MINMLLKILIISKWDNRKIKFNDKILKRLNDQDNDSVLIP